MTLEARSRFDGDKARAALKEEAVPKAAPKRCVCGMNGLLDLLAVSIPPRRFEEMLASPCLVEMLAAPFFLGSPTPSYHELDPGFLGSAEWSVPFIVGVVTLALATPSHPRDDSSKIEFYDGARSRHSCDNLPTAARLLGQYKSGRSRENRLCFILGPSGSRQTLFALGSLWDFRMEGEDPRSVAFYFKASVLLGAAAYSSSDAPSQLARAVRRKVTKHVRYCWNVALDEAEPLKMRV